MFLFPFIYLFIHIFCVKTGDRTPARSRQITALLFQALGERERQMFWGLTNMGTVAPGADQVGRRTSVHHTRPPKTSLARRGPQLLVRLGAFLFTTGFSKRCFPRGDVRQEPVMCILEKKSCCGRQVLAKTGRSYQATERVPIAACTEQR